MQKHFWFGPAGTVSPLHYDSYHNILSQVVGSKSILLVESPLPGGGNTESRKDIEDPMYPNVGSLQNTSRIDLQNEGWEVRFPNARGMVCHEVRLQAGESLYIPPRWWHFVLAEEVSVSVSFWW